jgi:hypothetical protein
MFSLFFTKPAGLQLTTLPCMFKTFKIQVE